MFLFYRLLLAHIIADFFLQTDKIFKVKMNTKWGVLVHTFIILMFSIFLVFPYLDRLRVIIILIIIFISHTIIDKIKLDYSKKTGDQNVKIFLLDQVLHIGIIYLLTFNYTEKVLFSSPFNEGFLNYLIHLYNNDILSLRLIGYILSIYSIPILLIFIKEDDTHSSRIFLKQRFINIEIPANKIVDKLYRLFLTLSAQYLPEQYIILIFIAFVVVSLISYQVSPERVGKIYNLKRIINSSLAIFIGILLKMI